jgi:hypothetical protein
MNASYNAYTFGIQHAGAKYCLARDSGSALMAAGQQVMTHATQAATQFPPCRTWHTVSCMGLARKLHQDMIHAEVAQPTMPSA